MHSNFNKIFSYIANEVKCFAKSRKVNLIVYGVLILCGIIVGIVVCSVSEMEYSSIDYLVLMGTEDGYSIFGVFVKILLFSMLAMALVSLMYFTKWCRPVPYLVLFYMAFRCGIRLASTVMMDKIMGVICILIFILPLYIVLLGAVLIATCIVYQFCTNHGYYRRCNAACKNIWAKMYKQILVVWLVNVLLIFVFAVLIPLIVQLFIVI